MVWQKAMDLVVHLYDVTTVIPREEIYGITSQLRRCAVSIPSNIAEGKCRSGDKEFHHFLSISDGSLAELKTQVEICYRLQYIRKDQFEEIIQEATEVGKLLGSLLKATSSRIG